jgi:hypothetical protein
MYFFFYEYKVQNRATTPQTQLQAFTKDREKQPKLRKQTYKPTLQKHRFHKEHKIRFSLVLENPPFPNNSSSDFPQYYCLQKLLLRCLEY